ncbi:MAG: ribonuclease E activity regulator RraA [Gammaproteobacteria bacterium]|nr:ribonuclease E activity regulator RraA [Gammaproteobacteria bacterium]
MTFKTADLCDAHAADVQILEPLFRSYGGRRRFCGPASTVRCLDDNSRVKEAVGEPGAGRMLIVDGGGSRRCALLGDLLARQAADNGWSGVIVHGCVRDSADISGFDLGVLALATLPRRSHRQGAGERDVPVEFAGARIRPGDFVYADEDGILVAPRALLAG